MNTPTRTIVALIVSNLLISGVVPAQAVSEREPQSASAIKTKEGDDAGREAETTVRVSGNQEEIEGLADVVGESSRRRAEIALSTPAIGPETPPPVRGTGISISRNRWPFQSGGTAPVLVIPSAKIETSDLLTINEDINVMSGIFETSLQQASILPLGGLFIDRSHALWTALSGRRMQSIYVQDYGVLFLMKVDFPLSPLHQVQEQDETGKEEEGDKVWQDMRRSLYEPEKVVNRKKDDSAAEYDAEKVENLKTTLVKALKHATNIRNLTAEESVILTVTGSGDFAGETVIATRRTVVVNGHSRVIQEPASVAAGSPTVLVIRAKKADIDSFAKGDLDLDQFRQRVQMLSYPYLEGGSMRADILDDYFRSASRNVPSF